MTTETLEKVIEISFRHYPKSSVYIKAALIGKEWQMERSYSEEEVMDILNKRGDDLDLWYNGKSISYPKEKKWFEQFKKK